jgi:VWFA-related protein
MPRYVPSALIAASAVLLVAAAPSPQQSPAPPQIPAGSAELVMVDAVVVDRDGKPVTDLSRDDFELREEGQPQPISHFESVQVERRASAEEKRPLVSTNVERPSTTPAPVLAVVFDERHLSADSVPAARKAVEALLTQGLAGGEVMLLATGTGEVWTAHNEIGLAALRSRMARLRGMRRLVPEHEAITEYEAYRIAVHEDRQALFRVVGRLGDLERARGGLISSNNRDARAQFAAAEAVERRARPLARQVWGEVSARSNATLAALEGLAQALVGRKGRKTAILITEGFVADPTSREWRRALDAARRTNLVIYGVDARGLQPGADSAAETFRKATFLGSEGTALTDIEASEGSDTLVTETGGTVRRRTNALAEAVLDISAEGRSYYLLGYQPSTAPDDKYRRLSVTVRRPGLTVRARKGYYALRTRPETARILPIPMRLAAYVGRPQPPGGSHVQVVGEFDPNAVEFSRDGERWTASVDWVADVYTPGLTSTAQTRRLRLSLTQEGLDAARKAWIPLGADFSLPPGAHVARLYVRDEKGGRAGAVDHVFEVPAAGSFYVTTVLSDMQRAAGTPAPAMIARRTFAAGSRLLCQFEVHGAEGGASAPYVLAGYEVRTAGGDVVGHEEPTLLAPTADGRLSRVLMLSLARTPPGRYELVLHLSDRSSGKNLDVAEPFDVIVGENVASR